MYLLSYMPWILTYTLSSSAKPLLRFIYPSLLPLFTVPCNFYDLQWPLYSCCTKRTNCLLVEVNSRAGFPFFPDRQPGSWNLKSWTHLPLVHSYCSSLIQAHVNLHDTKKILASQSRARFSCSERQRRQGELNIQTRISPELSCLLYVLNLNQPYKSRLTPFLV